MEDREEFKRKKFILDTLLLSSIFLLSIATIISCIDFAVHGSGFKGIDPTYLFIVLLVFIFLYFLSYKKYVSFSSFFLIGILYLLALSMGYTWGVDLPAEVLFYALIIVMSGILVNTGFAFFITLLICVGIVAIGSLQNLNIISVNRYWVNNLWSVGEMTVAFILFFTITIISWLYNREINRSLMRAEKSEAELKKERDSLEIIVEERTKDLKEMQMKKISQLYRFSEFGRLSFGLFHDLLNPLNAVSLNIEKIRDQDSDGVKMEKVKLYLDRAMLAAKKMGNLVNAIKGQISRKENKKLFCLNEEIEQIMDILAYKALKANVKINFIESNKIKIEGDPVKFNQVVFNLLANAMDAYEELDKDNKEIFVYLLEDAELIKLIVKDYGVGIPKENLKKIFESFFTTKKDGTGWGVGLSMIKRFIEKDFAGTIEVESDKTQGTIFTVKIPKTHSISEYLKQIKYYQQEDGSFLDDSEVSPIMQTSLILSCLNCCNDPEAKSIKEKAVQFLISQKNDDWQISKDVNINFCALASIAEYDKDLIDGLALVKILMLLTSIEVKEGGPYYSSDKTIDSLTNANIAKFLSYYDVILPSLESFSKTFNSISDMVNALQREPNIVLSAALYIENICISQKQLNNKNLIDFDLGEQTMINLIIEKAKNRFVKLPENIRQSASERINKVVSSNRDKQMSLIAYYTKEALGSRADKITDDVVAEMGLANIFFWTAFIIYDDFWDEDESAEPQFLPIANLYARSYVDFFNNILPEKTGFRDFFHSLMDKLDSSNAWETVVCRTKVAGDKFLIPDELPDYKNYDNKFYPAAGHILGPVAILIKLGYELDSPEIKNLIEYFKNYLIAMQINDDAHDWEEDMRRGHLSTVVAMLLEDLNCPKKEIDLDKDSAELKKTFWFKTVIRASEKVISHTQKARVALDKIGLIENKGPLEKYIAINENIARKALEEQKDSIEFLEKLED